MPAQTRTRDYIACPVSKAQDPRIAAPAIALAPQEVSRLPAPRLVRLRSGMGTIGLIDAWRLLSCAMSTTKHPTQPFSLNSHGPPFELPPCALLVTPPCVHQAVTGLPSPAKAAVTVATWSVLVPLPNLLPNPSHTQSLLPTTGVRLHVFPRYPQQGHDHRACTCITCADK